MAELPPIDQQRAPILRAERGSALADEMGFSPLEPMHLVDYLRTLHKRRHTALATFALVVAVAMAYTYAAVPIFEARVQLQIDDANKNIIIFKETIEQNTTERDYQQTQHKILQSRALARRTIETLKLWEHPELGGGKGKSASTRMSRVLSVPKAYVARFIGKDPDRAAGAADPAQAGTTGSDETGNQAPTIDAFLDRLTVTPVRNSQLVDVKFRSTDPALAAKVANALARAYIDQDLEFNLKAAKEANDWLGQQLAEQRKQVETSEAALQSYREKTDAVSLEDPTNVALQKLTDLNAAVTRARMERIQKEALDKHLQSIEDDPRALDSFPAIMTNTFIQQLKSQLADLQRQQAEYAERLGARHPEMIKVQSAIDSTKERLQAEIGKVIQSIHSESLAAEAQERSLVAAFETQKSQALVLNRQATNFNVLQRDAISNRQIFETLLQRTRESGISGELKSNNLRIVDAADEPRTPVWPQKQRSLLYSLLVGSALAVGMAFFVEYLDGRVKSPDDIKTRLGLPFLGLVPLIPTKNGITASCALINNGVPPKFSEALRAVRTNVLFSAPDNRSRSLMVTSTGCKEGKTLIASNLAVALAQAGQRIVLMDADMRLPRIHQIFEQTREPGLSNLLLGTSKASQAVRPSAIPNLWIVPAGLNPPNAADLLGSPKFRGLLRTLGEHFDWVVIDSPPVLAVTDAVVIAHAASAVLFVVSAERTNRASAQAALEQLDAARAVVLGAVLNRVDLERNAYYFGKYYRHEYGEYYTPAPRA
jgi:polysaccharide biosynthesis transport protein